MTNKVIDIDNDELEMYIRGNVSNNQFRNRNQYKVKKIN